MRTFLLTLHLLEDRSKVEWLVNNLELSDFDALEGMSFEPKALLVLRRYRLSAFNTSAQDNILLVLVGISTLRTIASSQNHSRKSSEIIAYSLLQKSILSKSKKEGLSFEILIQINQERGR